MKRYDAGTGSWGGELQLDTVANTHNWEVQLAVDPGGAAMATWAGEPAFLQGRNALFARRYSGGTWSAAERPDPNDFGAGRDHRIAADGAGGFTVVWRHAASASYSARTDMYARRWTPGGAWGPLALLETDDTGLASAPDVDADALGTAIAVWHQPEPGDPTVSRVWAARWDGGAWENPLRLDTSTASMQFAGVAVDPAGNGFAVWRRKQATTIHASRFDAATSAWSAAVVIGDGNTDPGTKAFTIDADAGGNAVALWFDGPHLRTNRWVAGGWEGQVQLNAATSTSDQLGQVRFDPTGKLHAIWTQYAGGAYTVVYSTWE